MAKFPLPWIEVGHNLSKTRTREAQCVAFILVSIPSKLLEREANGKECYSLAAYLSRLLLEPWLSLLESLQCCCLGKIGY